MANVIGNGKDRHLVDSDGDALDDGAQKLNVTLPNCENTDGADVGDKGLLVGGRDPNGDFEPILVDPDGEVQVGILSSTTLNVNATIVGDFSDNIPVEILGHGAVTSSDFIDIDNGYEVLPNGACKELILQADEDNTGYIMIGSSSGVDADNGIKLNAGDTFILNVTNRNLIYAWGSADNQKLRTMILT